MDKVLVGLSGGVDSSVAAASLQHQGYEVIGLTLWLMKGKGQCCSEGMVDAALICKQLSIPHHIIDTRDLFQTNIVDYLVSGYKSGTTPLPCSQCNKVVKFEPMLEYAIHKLKCNRIATGHYARTSYNKVNQRYQLLRAVDCNKDQSYFLYEISQEMLAKTIFPLGTKTKEETRRIANKLNLKTANKPESQDLCLIETYGSMKTFLDQHISRKEGDIVNLDGEVLGKHQGVHHYTVGQRKGLGIAATEPLYVTKLDTVMNRVIVANRDSAECSECTVNRMNWISIPELLHTIQLEVQIRYRSPVVPVNVVPLDNHRIKLVFHDPQFGVTPGQAAVLYDGEIVLGGGIIEK